MGKVTNSQQQPQADHQHTIHHFSHPHPLQLYNHHPQQTLSVSTCCGCKLEASGLIYACTFCSYFLHISCSKLPQHITHPCDQHNHVMSLLPSPAYPEGAFSCDACRMQGTGFSYHCGPCGIDLHSFCATKPLAIAHQSHQHQLNLTFSPPYQNKSFSCDVCHMLGSDHWLYRCNYCEFDVHMGCTTAKAPPRAPIPQTRVQQYQAAPRNQAVQNQPAPNMMNGMASQVIQGVVQEVMAAGGDPAADDGGGGVIDIGGDGGGFISVLSGGFGGIDISGEEN